ncbi:MAG: ribonuclease E [Verrucomicrobiae bacterium]|nr:ribonuclease E [Verrucomicrobiae bacterium]
MNHCRTLLLLALLSALPETKAAVLFEFDYSAGAEFLDPAAGPVRRAALEDAAATLGAVFAHDARIQLKVTSSNDSQGDLLASAFSEDPEVALDFFGFSPGIVQQKILTGVDANGTEADGGVDVNFGQPWDFDDQVSPDRFDFKATMIHEILHAIGFSSSIFEDGTDGFGTPPGEPGVWSTFDKFLAGPTGVSLIDDNYALNGPAWDSASTGGASPQAGLTFNGPNAMAANGGQPVGLYSPRRWEEGSSGSHLDDDNPALAGMVMLAATETGPYSRELSAIEKAILEDIGYTLASTTTPASASLTIQQSRSTITLTIAGTPGSYIIGTSTDMSNWKPLTTLTISQNGTTASYDLPLNTTSNKAEYFSASPQ